MDSRASRSGARCRRIDRDHRCTYIIRKPRRGGSLPARSRRGSTDERYRSLRRGGHVSGRLSASLVERWGRPAGLCRRGPSGRRPRSLSAGGVRCAQQRSVGSAAAVLHGTRRVEASPDADRAVHAASAADDRPAARSCWLAPSSAAIAEATGPAHRRECERYRSSRSKSCRAVAASRRWARKNDTRVKLSEIKADTSFADVPLSGRRGCRSCR